MFKFFIKILFFLKKKKFFYLFKNFYKNNFRKKSVSYYETDFNFIFFLNFIRTIILFYILLFIFNFCPSDKR
ncbi:MAG: hypothetical protein B6I24_06850 [Bacteroidetes bacterium 4572_128]|nr:MAG: hypothetical protein B6I24_06850 [Bacteroidetes bacterium 4572_128]